MADGGDAQGAGGDADAGGAEVPPYARRGLGHRRALRRHQGHAARHVDHGVPDAFPFGEPHHDRCTERDYDSEEQRDEHALQHDEGDAVAADVALVVDGFVFRLPRQGLCDLTPVHKAEGKALTHDQRIAGHECVPGFGQKTLRAHGPRVERPATDQTPERHFERLDEALRSIEHGERRSGNHRPNSAKRGHDNEREQEHHAVAECDMPLLQAREPSKGTLDEGEVADTCNHNGIEALANKENDDGHQTPSSSCRPLLGTYEHQESSTYPPDGFRIGSEAAGPGHGVRDSKD
mmetsp:Transcript_138996/g.387671  ORF Transcript_138996/g.387671 Transcript_138996/m.387671 type:complete len:292 (-) Transcript_138996:26-901(-)